MKVKPLSSILHLLSLGFACSRWHADAKVLWHRHAMPIVHLRAGGQQGQQSLIVIEAVRAQAVFFGFRGLLL
jgi:hypothetical protein